MELIVAVSSNWGIGSEGRLLFSIPEDMKFFRRMTEGKTVVMGRRTLETLPGGRPLKNRNNLILTRDPALEMPGAQVCHSVDEVLQAVRELPSEQVMVMGGEQVYRQLLPYCARAYVTHVEAPAQADSFFPDLSRQSGWSLEQRGEENRCGELAYRFCTYVNREVL